MTDKVQCASHGEREKTFVCTHLLGESAGLGFNRGDPTEDNPFPDAWCDNCELIRAAHEGWNDESQKVTRISLLCSGCYERTRIRSTRTLVTLDDLADFRWKCGSCEEWHTVPCLDFGYDSPYYWTEEHDEISRSAKSLPPLSRMYPKTLGENYCAIEDQHFFVRGIIHLPIIGTAETLRWGLWGSLSHQNFETLLKMDEDARRSELPPMFSWLSTKISEYPDTLSLKMYAHIQKPNLRPYFELEPSDHPLSQEYHQGITAIRVKEIMKRRLH